MSYVIAFVKFGNANNDYPVDCFRTDLAVNDQVIVRLSDGKLRTAIVTKLQHLNWDCKCRIECKVSESSMDDTGNIILPNKSLLVVGIATMEVFIAALKERSWIPLKPRQKMYRGILANINNTQTAHIFVRRNGIDIQLLPYIPEEKPRAFSLYQGSLSDGVLVRHYLAHTNFNLYEGVIRFSNSFLQNEENYERYFVPVGSRDKRTDELKVSAGSQKHIRDERKDIYDAISDGGCWNTSRDIYDCVSTGDGEDAYLGDGVWISSSGSCYEK
jgi:hypothetical protein